MRTDGAIITNAGQELLSYALANNKQVNFTKVKLGKGDVNTFDEAKNLTDVVSFYKQIPITSIARNNAGIVRIRSSFTNADFPLQVVLKEIGVFAVVEGKSEVLFSYVNDGEGESFPPGSSGNIVERVRDIYVGVSTNTQVTAVVDRSVVYATIFDLEEEIAKCAKKITRVNPGNGIHGGGTLGEDITVSIKSNDTSINLDAANGITLKKTTSWLNDAAQLFTAKGALNLFNTLTTNFTNGINAAKEVLRLDIVKKLNKGAYSGDAQDLKNDIDGHVRSVVSDTQNGHMSKEDKIKLDNIDDNANNYSLPVASGSTLGGVKIGNNLSVSGDGTISGLSRYIHPIETGFYHIPAGGGNNQFIKWESDGIGTWDFIDWDFIQNNPINPNWRYCCSLRHSDTATSGYTITTNIPFNANGMYHIKIEGYAYGSAMPIMIDLVFYIYPPDSTTFLNCRYHYYGYDPGQIILFHNNDNIRIFIQNNIYYISLNVYATVGTLGDKTYLNGWSMVENGEQPSGVSVAVLKRKIYTEDDKPTIQEIGAMPLLGNRNADFNLNNRLSQTELLQEYTGTMNFSDIINGFPMVNNANGILTFNTHSGSYGHQVGFSSNGKMYHRASSAGTWNDWSEFIKRGKSDLLWSGAHYMDSREVLSLTNIDFNDYQAICLYVSCDPSPAVDSNLAGQMLCPTAEYGAVSYSWLDLTGRDWCGAYLINNYQIQPYAGAGVWILRVVGMR